MAGLSKTLRGNYVQTDLRVRLTRIGSLAVHLLATVQLVWFYLARVPNAMHLLRYEQGTERTPFQYRLLLAGPLAWTHTSMLLGKISTALSDRQVWFGRGVSAEGLAEACIDVIAVGVTGLAARKLYQRASSTCILLPVIYPLTLVMIASMYALVTVHAYRFVYDLPGIAFFSAGLYFIYARLPVLYFAILFCIATLNRETTLLLLLFFIVAECSRADTFDLRHAVHRRTVAVVMPLSMAWLGWHLWVTHHYARNPSAAGPRVALNLALMVIPFTWPQLLGVYGYLLPMVIAGRRAISDPVLRNWLFLFPVWAGVMLWYGLYIETRIFGELIAYFACVAALIFEANILQLLHSHRWDASKTHTS